MSKVAIISHSHPLLKSGGGEVAAYRQFLHMRQQGHDALFLGVAFEPKTIGAVFAPDQHILQLGEHDYCLRATGMDSFTMEHARAEDEDAVFALLLSLNADVYHFHHFWNIGAGVIRRLRRARPDARLICTLHELTAICANHGQMIKTGGRELCRESSPLACASCFPERNAFDFVARKRRMIELVEQFDELIAPSAFLARRFCDWGVSARRFHVVENGIAPRNDVEHVEMPPGTLSRRFAFFGQATPTKGLDILVHAAQWIAASPDKVDLSIDVFGVTQEGFEEIWPNETLPPNLLNFHGRYQAADAVDLMARYGWIVIPSVWWENSPVVIQEARLANSPVIASNIGGMKEKVEGWGHLFEVGDPVSLGHKMLELAGNDDAMEDARRKMTAPLSLEDYFDAWSDIVYDTLELKS
ncbi:MAG: glycosyltransferase [Paracoccaceae bacterium]